MNGERSGSWRDDNLLPFVRRVVVVVAILAFAALLFFLRDLMLVFFGAVLVGVIFYSAAGSVRRITGLGHRFSLTVACLIIFAVLGTAGAFLWPFFQTQVPSLLDRVAGALNQLEDTFGITLPDTAQEVAEGLSGLSDQLLSFLTSLAGALVAAVSGIALVIVAGIFLAARPDSYRDGAVLLFPTDWHSGLRRVLAQVRTGLLFWLRAQFVAMIVVGVLTGVGAWIIGLPSPMALGLFAGLGEFIPIVGPLVAALPALLVAFAEGGDLIFWTLGLYILVQQLEANILTPWLQHHFADVPPVVLLFAMVAFGLVFGILGVILAAPLTVAMTIIVREIYMRDILSEDHLVPPAPATTNTV